LDSVVERSVSAVSRARFVGLTVPAGLLPGGDDRLGAAVLMTGQAGVD
jgi:hypothetical protein